MEETFQIRDIVSNGDFSPQSRDALSVLWAITKGCNYQCSYCAYSNKAKLTNFSSQEQLLRAAQVLMSLNKPRYQITLYGGEPTYHPAFHALLEYLIASEAPISLRMFTNGSRSPQYFEKTVAITRGTNFGIIFSLHLERAKFANFRRAIEITTGAGMSTAINLMFHPELRELAREYADELLAMRMNIPFFMNFCFPYTVHGVMGKGCVDEDFAWAKASREAFDRIPMPSHLISPFFTRITSNITLERDGKRETLAPEESLQLLAKLETPSYRDFYCCAGTNVYFIEEEGTVRGGVCDTAPVFGNIFHDSATALIENMRIVRCTSGACSANENIPLPKFRKLIEAEACVSQFKERARAYLPRTYRREVNESVYDLMKRLGVRSAVADAVMKHIPDLLEELGNKAEPVPGLEKLLRILATKALKRLTRRK